ncbi:MAG: hypothetical protein K0R15_237 [Clostridiales bacterium]|nr:hypothetical protein [Clostridiales bacterium]
MHQEIDKILDMLREQKINVVEAERLIKAIRKNYMCDEVKQKVQDVLDITAKVILKTVDYTTEGVEKINPVIKRTSTKVAKFVKAKVNIFN